MPEETPAAQTAQLIKDLLKPTPCESAEAARLDKLRQTFALLLSNGELSLGGVGGTKASKTSSTNNANDTNVVSQQWNTWLRKKFFKFIHQLSTAVRRGRKSALRTFMGIIAAAPLVEPGWDGERLNDALLRHLLEALIESETEEDIMAPIDEGLLELFLLEFLKFRDVQYFTMVGLKQLANELYSNKDEDNSQEEMEFQSENLMRILMKVYIGHDQEDMDPTDVNLDNRTASNYLFFPPTSSAPEKEEEIEEGDVHYDGSDDDSLASEESDETNSEPIPKKQKLETRPKVKLPSWQKVRMHRNVLQQSTLSILKIKELPSRSLKRILQHLPIHILPHVPNPLRFADFCSNAYAMGGITALLALHSLFLLMTKEGLEYPEFYGSLYNLIQSPIFYAKYRTRFFKLLVKCLTGSQMLPAYLVAAFCKRLCRCALNAPPSSALFVLALVSNLIRKHGECACIVHRSGKEMEDPYDSEAKDPAKSKAIESSLWELNALERHYHPAVAGLAKACGTEDEKALMHNLDDFLLHTYKSLFEQERKRGNNKRRNKVPLTFVKPKGLFIEGDVFDGVFDFPSS